MWIGEAIESVLKQTFKYFELIIVDDASDDGSAEIIKYYAKKDSRIKYKILKSNKGAIGALKQCYDLCSGKYLAIISSDDVWELDKLALQVSVLDRNKKIGAVFALPIFIDANSTPITIIQNEFTPSLNLKTRTQWMNFFFNKGNCVCHPTILIRKECYEKIGFYNPTFRSLPDFEMWVRLFYQYDVKILNAHLIKFRKHEFNESGEHLSNIIRCQTEYKQILNNFIAQIKTVKEMIEIFPEHYDLFKANNNLLVPFYFAQIALKRKEAFTFDFAFDILHTEMAKPTILKIVEQYNLYSVVQLSKDVTSADIYLMRENIKIKNFPNSTLITIIKKCKSKLNFIFNILKVSIYRGIRIKSQKTNKTGNNLISQKIKW
tara:strand:- start:3203 stop:4330 length:1128 start_codon:yes stop_codon:yes gene_type:complete